MTFQVPPDQLRFLPVGAIRPRGWIRELLAEDADGITGHLDELSPHAGRDVFASQRIASAAKGGWWDGEVVGNWLDGLVRLAAIAEREGLAERVDAIVDRVLASQEDDGYLGAYQPGYRWQADGDNGELWSQSRLFSTLLGWHEATGNPRILEALQRAATLTMMHHPPRSDGRTYFDAPPDGGDTGRTHGLMIIEPVLRIAELTDDSRLREFASFLYQDYSRARLGWLDNDMQLPRLADETAPFAGHGVHVCEHLRIPLLLYAHTGDPRYRLAFQAAVRKLLPNLGVSGACKSDEELGLAELGGVPLPESGYEYCTSVELTLSWLQAAAALHDMRFADHAELLVLNAAQGARLDGKAIGYTAADNQYAAQAAFGPRWKYSPTHDDVATCCAANAGRLWPYVVSRMAARAGEWGLTVLFYGPCVITHTVDDARVTVEQDTAYPFEDTVLLRIHAPRPVTFPLGLRIPGWARQVTVRLNDEDVPIDVTRQVCTVERTWHDGDCLRIHFTPAVELVPAADRSVAVRRGPLLYVLPIPATQQAVKHYPVPGFADLELTPAPGARWDYAFQVFGGDTRHTFTVSHANLKDQANPWHIPRIYATALDPRSAPPGGEDTSVAPGLASLELVPMGRSVLRRTCFPLVNRPPLANPAALGFHHADSPGDACADGGALVD